MKKLLLFIYILLTGYYLQAQNYGNEWIDYSQQYYKIKIVEDGVYRISQQELASAGVPTGTFDPRNLQLFRDGVEQYIYVAGENDAVFSSGEYIEFVGNRSNGSLDVQTYPLTERVNEHHNMYTDTAVYFLTWNRSLTNRRLQEESNTNFSSYSPQGYCIVERTVSYTGLYNDGGEGGYISEPEGWVDSYIAKGASRSYPLNTQQYYSGGGSSSFEVCVAGFSNTDHNLNISLPGVTFDTAYNGLNVVRRTFRTSASLTNETGVTVSSDVSDLPADKNCVSYISYRYPHTFNFEGLGFFSFISNATTSEANVRYDISNFITTSDAFLIDESNHKRILLQNNSGTLRGIISNTVRNPQLVAYSAGAVQSVVGIQPVSSFNGSSSGMFHDFLQTSGDYIIITHAALQSGAREYADYRRSKNYTVILVDANELYDQFGYGNYKHPGGIKNFLRYAKRYWNQQPQHVFLIGKSYYLSQYRNSSSYSNQSLVPSIGSPPADNLYTMGLSSNSYESELSIGRLAAITNDQISIYLDKVREYESNAPAEWMKHVMHFGGGGDTREQTTFARYLSNYETIIEGQYMGAEVHTFLKQSSATIEQTKSDYILQRINDGTSILNFFGHASGEGFDQNIDPPSAYLNRGKYPLIVANSCYTGDIHNANNNTLNAQWIFIEDKGAIGFLAGVGVGYASYLNEFTEEFYQNTATYNYGNSIGSSISATINSIVSGGFSNVYSKNTAMAMTLHGDPAIEVNSFEQPDLIIDQTSISFEPEYITNAIDSFDVQILITNAGKTFDEDVELRIVRSYPDGSSDTVNYTHSPIYYRDTITLTFPVDIAIGIGTNFLSVEVDPNNVISEYQEGNNTVILDFLVISTELLPVWPYDLSIIPDNEVELIASTVMFRLGVKECVFEIDTSSEFNSPFKKAHQVSYNGSIVKWNMPFSLTENTVYYWRVSNVPTREGETWSWNKASFKYREGITGWAQSSFAQLSQSSFEYIDSDPQNGSYEFVDAPKRLYCNTIGTANNNTEYAKSKYLIDGTQMDWGACGANHYLNVVVIDPVSLDPWLSSHGSYGHYNYPGCGPEIDKFMCFQSNNANARMNLARFLNDSVPDGHYILIFTFISGNFLSMEEDLLLAFERLGSSQIRYIQNDLPYIFFTRKGDISSTREVVGNNSDAEISLEANLITNYIRGTVTSPVIGPSSHFSRLLWEPSLFDSSLDSVAVKIIGIKKSGETEDLFDFTSLRDMPNLPDIVDPSLYSAIRLVYQTIDRDRRTPEIVDTWEVHYTPAPELVLYLDEEYSFYNDTIQQGDEIQLLWKAQNISPYPMDSVWVNYTIKSDKNQVVNSEDKRLANLNKDQIVIDTFSLNTKMLQGRHLLKAEFNALNPQKGTYDQLEQYHFNNIVIEPFFVQSDQLNPLLDVTFDGIRIMDGDLVSAKPEIVISLSDENKFFTLDDPSLFEVYLDTLIEGSEVSETALKTSGFSEYNIIPVDSLEFEPADGKENKAKLIFKPVFTKDGTYILRVNAKDKSGNSAGGEALTISFTVITKSTISHILNYPNPFSTSTRFVFELTGSELPTDLRIQIMTVTGKLVKEIGLEELGHIHIGLNKTEYAWDGTDMFGDKLANGVYFYKVIAKLQSESIEHRALKGSGYNIDRFFKEGIGKLYIMR